MCNKEEKYRGMRDEILVEILTFLKNIFYQILIYNII